ncbi:LysR family transcriptional regulator [Gordonia soli]|uniref:Putative LysR family transcriptional regulator n=1 Tax=Gordonia soli NBRC 108243 TaxID=1223545 RepID=M0QGT1_9ACTN|nr:LysR family transcriptional regulator [Gordonia soli]GAC66622.1 putative LysR family transcriptional regulator [Gordonia soli NBRC 108243]
MDEWLTELAPQLRALVELAATDGHITGSAAALGVPQSSMSRRIHALEAALAVPLVVRDGRTVRLTPRAIDLAEQIRGPLREVEAALAQAAVGVDPEHGTVRFGFPLTLGVGVLPALLAEFRHRHPGIRLELRQAHGAALVDDLRRGTLDLAVTIPPPTDLPYEFLTTQEVCVAMPDDHRLAGQGTVRLEELVDEEFIANPPSYHLRQITERWCRDAGFVPSVGIEVTEFATIRDFVRRGLGVALLPPVGRRFRGIVEKSLSGGDHTRAIALTSATTTLGPATELLSEFIRDRGLVPTA